MGIKSGGYNATLPEQRPFKYWALLAAINRVMTDVPYPDVVDVLDSLIAPMSETQHALDGKRIYPSRGMGGSKPARPTIKQLEADLIELEATDADVRAAAARYDQMVQDLTDRGRK